LHAICVIFGYVRCGDTAASALEAARYPEKFDLFWISQNCHDSKDPFMGRWTWRHSIVLSTRP